MAQVRSGGRKVAAVPFEVAGFARFGCPMWVMPVVGAVPFVGAVGSRRNAGDPILMPVPAFVPLILPVALACAPRGELLGRERQAAPRRG